MDRDSFLFYRAYMEAADMMPDNKQLKFYKIIIDYGLTGAEPADTGDPLIDMALKFIRPLIKANIQNYQNGCKGGAPKGTVNNPKGKNQYSKTTAGKPEDNRGITVGKSNVNDNVNVKDNVKDKDKVNVNDNVNVNVNDKDINTPAAASFEEEFIDYDEKSWFDRLEDDRDKK